jgi:hypothetical protein
MNFPASLAQNSAAGEKSPSQEQQISVRISVKKSEYWKEKAKKNKILKIWPLSRKLC